MTGLFRALAAVFCLAAIVGDSRGSLAALQVPGCGAWKRERIGPAGPPSLEIVEPTNGTTGACEAVFRVMGVPSLSEAQSRAVQIEMQLENVRTQWVPPLHEPVSLLLVPPLESELRVVPENSDEPASVKFSVGYSPETIGADLSRHLLQTGLDLLPPETCSISDKQLAFTVHAVAGGLAASVAELLNGNIHGLPESLSKATPRLFKSTADTLSEAGLKCGETHFKELARRTDLIEAAVSETLAWLPQMLFSMLAATNTPETVLISYMPARPEVTYRTVGVRTDDVLNIRSGAGVDHPITGSIPPDGTGIRQVGPVVRVGPSSWVLIAYQGVTGWVNSRYLEAETPP